MEEQQQDEVDPDYLKGFNEGYLLAQYNPELAQTLASVNSKLSRVAGLKAGLEQYHAEQIHTQQQEESEPDRQKSDSQPVSDQPDVFDQLYRQQEELNQKLSSPPDSQQKSEEEEDLFSQLKKKQEQGHSRHDIEP